MALGSQPLNTISIAPWTGMAATSNVNKIVAVSANQIDTAKAGIALALTSKVPVGILSNNPGVDSAGDPKGGSVVTAGVYDVVSDGSGTTIAVGDPLASNGSGVATKCQTAGWPMIGIALEESQTNGLKIPCAIAPGVF